jgi:penicillin-binding protein 2
MFHRSFIKDHYKETQIFKRRALFAAVFVVLLIGVLLLRLVDLQYFEHHHFKTLSENNRIRLMSIGPNRGLIYDRNGVVLAENRPSFQLEIVPEQIDDMARVIKELSALVELDERTLKRFYKAIKRSRRFQGVALRTKLSAEEVARLAVNRHRFPGVEITARLSRYYPQGKRAVHVVGYVGRIDEDEVKKLDAVNYAGTSHIGKAGLEKYYEDQLHGIVGYQSVEVNVQGRVLRVLEKSSPVPGQDLILTLDSRLQAVAEEAMGDYTGSIVAMLPASGEVVAMVSMPTFDPNLFVHGISHKEYNRLRESSKRPLFNRALMGQYPPGSTLKPFVGLAGLESRVVGHRENVMCKGFYQLPTDEHKYRDWKKTGHGAINMDQALAQSCDVYFYELSYRLGINRMHDFLHKFGFGQKTGLDSVGEKSGLLPSRKWKQRVKGVIWFPGETLISGIGQGYMLSTPLQLATATSILATRGIIRKPYLLKQIEDPLTDAVALIEHEVSGTVQLQRPSNWQHIVKGMVSVMHDNKGTARSSGRNLDFKIAGKTGTSQVFSIAQDEEYDEENVAEKLRDHALFIAFAPHDHAEIVVAVIAENGGHGSRVAAPMGRKVIDAWMRIKN